MSKWTAFYRDLLDAPRTTVARILRHTTSAPSTVALDVEGQVSAEECAALSDLARAVRGDQVVIEVGSYRGRSTIALGRGSAAGHRCRVFAVDPHDRFVGVLGASFGPEDQAALYANLIRAGMGEIVAVVCLPSLVAGRAWPSRNVGLLWIDGDHRYEAVSADFAAWAPHLAKDSIVAFHDMSCDGVDRCVRELEAQGAIRKVGALGDMAWFRSTACGEADKR